MENNIITIDKQGFITIHKTDLIEMVATAAERGVAAGLTNPNEELYTASEIAKKLKLDRSTVTKYTSMGILQSYDIKSNEVKAVRYKLKESLKVWKKRIVN